MKSKYKIIIVFLCTIFVMVISKTIDINYLKNIFIEMAAILDSKILIDRKENNINKNDINKESKGKVEINKEIKSVQEKEVKQESEPEINNTVEIKKVEQKDVDKIHSSDAVIEKKLNNETGGINESKQTVIKIKTLYSSKFNTNNNDSNNDFFKKMLSNKSLKIEKKVLVKESQDDDNDNVENYRFLKGNTNGETKEITNTNGETKEITNTNGETKEITNINIETKEILKNQKTSIEEQEKIIKTFEDRKEDMSRTCSNCSTNTTTTFTSSSTSCSKKK